MHPATSPGVAESRLDRLFAWNVVHVPAARALRQDSYVDGRQVPLGDH